MALSDEFRREEESRDDEEEEEDGRQENEKQISIDPMSLNQPPQLAIPKFVSASLPCSAPSSPESSSPSMKWSNPTQWPHPAFHPSLARHHSIAQPQYPWHKSGSILLPRSKSCGDGRSSQPSDEFDILSRRHKKPTGQLTFENGNSEVQEQMPASRYKEEEQEFKCGAMCLFLPGFVRKKQEQVQLQRQASQESKGEGKKEEEDEYQEENRRDAEEKEENRRSIASRAVSLERFECASWSSAVLVGDIEDNGISAYFDLPLELIRGSTDDANSPVRAAFVFDSERKGVLRTSASKSGPRKSHENRHVRFSTSQPTPASPDSGCVTPKLFQAREEFGAALLEAQNAFINF